MAVLISSGIASHRLSIRGFGSLNGLTTPTIRSIASLVNPNLASVLIFQLVDFTLQVSSEVGPEREAIFEPELDVCIGAWGIAHGFGSTDMKYPPSYSGLSGSQCAFL
jgi:hypothetical protein